jgi:hypothetical protein
LEIQTAVEVGHDCLINIRLVAFEYVKSSGSDNSYKASSQ